MRLAGVALLVAASAFGQPARPDVAAQAAAMKKLAFLTGAWEGGGWTRMGPGEPVQFKQTEDVQLKLDGTLLVIEGTGRDPASGEKKFNAFAVVSFDDATKKYRFRAWNGGRHLDVDFEVVENGFAWSYPAGPAKVRYTMKLTEKGEWLETGEVTMGDNPPMKIHEMTLRRK